MKNLKKSKYIVLLSVLLVSLTLTACGASDDKEVVATVGDEEITQDEFYDKLVEINGEEVLNSLISEKIVQAEIKKQDIKIDSEEIDKEFATMQDQYGGEEGLAQALEASGISEKEFKTSIEEQLAIKALLEDKLNVSDEDVKAYYEENKEQFSQEEQVNASHVLVKDEKVAKDVKKKLDDGGKMEELAKEYSEDPGSKDTGGNLGFFGKGEMVPEFEKAAFSLKVGEISEPIKSEHGYHVILVNDKKEAKESSFDENKDKIKMMLVDQQLPEAFNAWYSEKSTEYDITSNLNK